MNPESDPHLAGLDLDSPFGSRTATLAERLVWAASDARPLPAFLRRRLRKRFARPHPGPFDVNLEGMKMRLYPAENYCDRVMFGRRDLPERAEHEALIPFIRPGCVFVDIGANVGSYSAYVGTWAKGDLTLIAFEPHPRTFAKLRFNLAANSLPLRHLINCAIGPERAELPLYSDGGGNIGHTSMLEEGTANAAVSVTVPVAPLLEVLTEHHVTRIDILKIDVEGYEDRALAPFFDTAPEQLWPATMLIETAHQSLWQRDLTAMLAERGYVEAFATKENVLLTRA